ncbi:unnamed protein product [Dicrocoelium dendriticum]|nr:unnamed protein product [Dicrocoelium dendriticum]
MSGAEESAFKEITVADWEFNDFSVHITVMLFLLTMVLIKIGFHRIPYLSEYVPESLLLIILGVIFGAIIRYGVKVGSYEATVWVLTPTLFFNYLLPPIVLESSYSLYNRTFSEYLGVVLIFAVFGTICNFLIIGFVMYGLERAGAMGDAGKYFDLKGQLLFSSLIVAVDPVAVLAIFQDIGVELSLYYIVFGESLLNDAITVVLYDIMSAFAGRDTVTGQQIGVGIASFFTVSFGGLLIGVVVGIISCLLTRIRSHLNAFSMILLAYFSYIMADCVGWSGIISMIGCGLLQAAYAFQNIDYASVTMVHKLTKIVSEICESVIFLYLGIEILNSNLEWHTGFILWSLVLCLVARAIVVLGITAIVNAVNVDGTKMPFSNQLILIYGGLRGAVAFSLSVLVVPDQLGFHGLYGRRLMITATLFIIVFTVGFMGMTMKPLVKALKIRMQAANKLSLFTVLNDNALDEMLAGIEIIAGNKGRNVIRDFFIRLDEKYLRKILQNKPEPYSNKLMHVYEKIALQLHLASTIPQEMESYLTEIPESLRTKFLSAQLETTALGLRKDSRQIDTDNIFPAITDLEAADEPMANVKTAAKFAEYIRSPRKASIIPRDKRQMDFNEELADVMQARHRFIKHSADHATDGGTQVRRESGVPNLGFVPEESEERRERTRTERVRRYSIWPSDQSDVD